MLYKNPNGGIGTRPTRIGNTFIGSQTDLTQYGFLPVSPTKPDEPDGQRAVPTNGREEGGEWVVNWVLEDIPPRPPVDYGTNITRFAFRQRMTAQEKVAFENAIEADAGVRVLSKDFELATYIDLANPVMASGMDALVAAGVLTQERADEIVNAPVQEHEVPG